MLDTKHADFRLLVRTNFREICPDFIYPNFFENLALFRAKMYGIWPLGRLKLNKNANSGYHTILHLVFDLFSLPAGLHLKLGLTLFQAIKERHIDGREVESTVDSG